MLPNPAQIAYCAGILARGGIYAARVFDGSLQRFCLRDAYGLVNLYALPFVRPSQVRRFFPEAEIKSFEQAVRCILEAADIPAGERNVLIEHQYVAGARTCESDELSIGGKEQIPAAFFMVAGSARKHPGIVERMRKSGYQVGIHSLSHESAMLSGPGRTGREGVFAL